MRVKVFLSLFIRIIKSTEDVTKRESEELQLDKLMPSREPMQDVKQAGNLKISARGRWDKGSKSSSQRDLYLTLHLQKGP